MADKHLAGGGKKRLLLLSIVQLFAKFIFNVLQAVTKGRLGYEQFPGGLSNIFCLKHRFQNHPIKRIHSLPSGPCTPACISRFYRYS
jgi:hypothetical protein